MTNDEVRLRVMRLIQDHPQIAQRDLAKYLGVSLGKANYCLKALVEKGFIKAENFRRSDRKRAYLYLLTPTGVEEKARVTAAFLRRKLAEFEAVKQELEFLRSEVGCQESTNHAGWTGGDRIKDHGR